MLIGACDPMVSNVRPRAVASPDGRRTHSLTPSLVHSLDPSLPHSFTPSRNVRPRAVASPDGRRTHSLTPSLVHSLDPSLPHSFTPSRNVRPRAVASPDGRRTHSLTPSLVHSLDPSLPHSFTPSRNGRPQAVASPDGRFVAVHGYLGPVQLYLVKAKGAAFSEVIRIADLGGHTKEVDGVSFSPDSRVCLIVGAGLGAPVRFLGWDCCGVLRAM